MNASQAIFNFGKTPQSFTSAKFANPWYSPAMDYLPTTLETAWDFCLFLWTQNPDFANGLVRVGCHFLTKVVADDASEGDRVSKTAWSEWMMEELGIMNAGLQAIIDTGCYGNAMCYIHTPFDRMLVDDRDGRYVFHAIGKWKEEDVKYNYKTMRYNVPDPVNPGARVDFRFEDMKVTDRKRIKIIFLDPRRTILNCSTMGATEDVLYRFDPMFLADIKSGRAIWQVNDTCIEMLRAIRDDVFFKFARGEVFHFRQPTVTGLSKNGWGIPPPLAMFRSLYNLALYKRIDEAIGHDFMTPWRIVCPTDKMGALVQENHMDLGIWNNAFERMTDARRADPTALFSFPVPIVMQQFGGDGKNLVPKDIAAYQRRTTLADANVPSELFEGSLAVQVIPATMRFFENSNMHVRTGLASFVRWVSLKIRAFLEMPEIGVRLAAPGMADNIENKQILIQMIAGGEIPRSEGYGMLGLGDPVNLAKGRDEEDFAIEENRFKLRGDFEKRMQNNGQLPTNAPGGGPVGGPPVQAGGSSMTGPTPEDVPITPMRIASEAEEIATDLLTKGDQGHTKRTLAGLQARSDGGTLYAAVKQKMEEARSSAASQGRAGVGQMLQQQQQPPPQQ